jgi:hypothetical protein
MTERILEEVQMLDQQIGTTGSVTQHALDVRVCCGINFPALRRWPEPESAPAAAPFPGHSIPSR